MERIGDAVTGLHALARVRAVAESIARLHAEAGLWRSRLLKRQQASSWLAV